ncbi:hypothetical protein, partial [Arachidicoccus sp.]|uniref:hypothetical protein n=1 Tax=Arachidicoccus sp. TaxID=1872624 RepID=UPI003D1B8B3B
IIAVSSYFQRTSAFSYYCTHIVNSQFILLLLVSAALRPTTAKKELPLLATNARTLDMPYLPYFTELTSLYIWNTN